MATVSMLAFSLTELLASCVQIKLAVGEVLRSFTESTNKTM